MSDSAIDPAPDSVGDKLTLEEAQSIVHGHVSRLINDSFANARTRVAPHNSVDTFYSYALADFQSNIPKLIEQTINFPWYHESRRILGKPIEKSVTAMSEAVNADLSAARNEYLENTVANQKVAWLANGDARDVKDLTVWYRSIPSDLRGRVCPAGYEGHAVGDGKTELDRYTEMGLSDQDIQSLVKRFASKIGGERTIAWGETTVKTYSSQAFTHTARPGCHAGSFCTARGPPQLSSVQTALHAAAPGDPGNSSTELPFWQFLLPSDLFEQLGRPGVEAPSGFVEEDEISTDFEDEGADSDLDQGSKKKRKLHGGDESVHSSMDDE